MNINVHAVHFLFKTILYLSSFLEQNAEYVLSLAAVNDMGFGPIVYLVTTIKEQNIVNTLEESSNPIIPPIGLKTNVISPNAIEVSWTDNSLLDDIDVIYKYMLFFLETNQLIILLIIILITVEC